MTKVQAYDRRQEFRGPQAFLEEFAGPRQVKLETDPAAGIPRVEPEDLPEFPKDQIPHMDPDNMLVWDDQPGVPIKSCRKDANFFCMQEGCVQWDTCKQHVIKYDDFTAKHPQPSSWNPADPRRVETEEIQAAARAHGEITEQQAMRIEELADDLITDYLAEKRWNAGDHTFREWWLGPISNVPDRSWAYESWGELPGEVKVQLMRTYQVAER